MVSTLPTVIPHSFPHITRQTKPRTSLPKVIPCTNVNTKETEAVTPKTPSTPDLLPVMLAGATAGSFTRLPLHPIDTCKAKMQVQSSGFAGRVVYKSTLDAIRSVFRTEGIVGLYRGLPFTALASGPASMLYFTSYEWSKNHLLSIPHLNDNAFVAHFTSGLVAEAISCLLWVPIDVVKERLQVQSTLKAYHYEGSMHAMRSMVATEGFRSLYKGYGATVLSFGPFSAFNFLFFEKFKSFGHSLTQTPFNQPLSFHTYMIAGAAAGALASFITSPLDMAKLRLQVQRATSANPSAGVGFYYRNWFDALSQIFTKEGLKGAFRGAGARVAFHAPFVSLSMSLNEYFKQLYSRHLSI